MSDSSNGMDRVYDVIPATTPEVPMLAGSQDHASLMDVAASRQAQEVQAAMIVAKKVPRDENRVLSKIKTACQRPGFAAIALYKYQRGGTVTGPSIRLAEEMIRAWGNVDYGTKELASNGKETVMEAYCWDLETNSRYSRIFTVRHIRDAREGSKELKDQRDIYENNANLASRRLRACILAVIPRDIQDLAVSECQRTNQGKNSGPLADNIRAMILAFRENLGVTQEMIERYAKRKAESFTAQTVADLREVFQSIRDGMSDVSDWFEFQTPALPEPVDGESKSKRLAKKAKPSVPETLQEFMEALSRCGDEDSARETWKTMVLDIKDQFSTEDYHTSCALRDERIKTIQA